MTRKTVRLGVAAVFVLAAACSVEPPLAPDADPLPVDGGSGGGDTPEETPTLGLSGRLTGLAGHAASGGVTFSASNGVGSITFADDFRSSPVPDPQVYLNTTTDANQGSPLRISALRSPSGAQTYSFSLPVGITYTHVLVWCDRYNVGVGVAPVS